MALFVVKFRGAGQGAKALIAELLAGMMSDAAGLPTPEMALIELLPDFGQTEPDPEIQDLLRASVGITVGLRYLDGAFDFQPASAGGLVTPELAARIVWLDAFTTPPATRTRWCGTAARGSSTTGGAVRAAQLAHGGRGGTRAPFPLIRTTCCCAAAGISRRPMPSFPRG